MDSSSRSSSELFHESKNALLKDFPPPLQDTTVCDSCRSRRKKIPRSLLISWFTSFILLVFLGLSIIKSRSCDRQDFWRSSEFGTVLKEIPATFKQVLFNATLQYNEDHKVYRPVTDPPYVGSPSPEIDAAWEELLGAVNVFVTPEEEKLVGSGLWLDPETGLHMAQVSVFHDLHCLNMIRKSMYLDYYPKMNDFTLASHVEHCMDMLRLSLMCNGDMTLIPIKWSENRNWILPEFDTLHTCRDYSALREWSLDRDAANPETYPKNAERLKSKGS